jgi:arylsulfatase A-like enzyme
MVIRWPDHVPAGTTSRLRLTNMDFFPTLMELCGGNTDDLPLDGKDLSRKLFTPREEPPDDRSFLWHFPAYLQAYTPEIDDGRDPLFRTRPCTTLLKGPWKLHHFYEDDALELYNLEDDLGERRNLADQHPDTVKEMLAEMNALLETHDLPIPTEPNPEYDEAVDKKLQADVQIPVTPPSPTEEEWYRVMSFID